MTNEQDWRALITLREQVATMRAQIAAWRDTATERCSALPVHTLGYIASADHMMNWAWETRNNGTKASARRAARALYWFGVVESVMRSNVDPRMQ